MNVALLRFYFSINVIMFVLLAFSFPFLEAGTGSAVVAQLSLVIVVPSIVISGLLIYRATRSERNRSF